MDTGAGSKGFSIIEQGAIGKIITAKPEDRRTLIEEAAESPNSRCVSASRSAN